MVPASDFGGLSIRFNWISGGVVGVPSPVFPVAGGLVGAVAGGLVTPGFTVVEGVVGAVVAGRVG